MRTGIGAGQDTANSLALQADGRIVLAGFSHNGTNFDLAVARYNADGSLDTGFDGDGTLTTTFGSGDDFGDAVAIQADGKIVVAGRAFTGAKQDFGLVRFNPDGSLDPSFDGDGRVTTSIGSVNDAANGLLLQADGQIVATGFSNNGANSDFALARYDTSGALDTRFNAVTTSLDGTPAFTEGGPAVVLDADVDVSDAELDALNAGLGNYAGASLTMVRRRRCSERGPDCLLLRRR